MNMQEKKGISIIGQIGIYFGKCCRIFNNEKGWKNLVSSAINTLILCSVIGDDMFRTFSDTQSGNFALTCACIWVGIFNSIRTICSERAIIKREHRVGMSIIAYISAHTLFEGILCMGESAIITLIICIFNIGRMPSWGILLPTFIELFIDYALLLFSADLLGMLVSCIVRNENSAMTVMPFVLIIEMVMAGTVFELDGFAKTFSNLMISRWGLATMCVTANTNSLSYMNYNEDYIFTIPHQLWLWGIMLLFCIVTFCLCNVFLSFVDKDKR